MHSATQPVKSIRPLAKKETQLSEKGFFYGKIYQSIFYFIDYQGI
jgi:hypothetical protein